MFASTQAASAPMPATAHHPSARRRTSSTLTCEISNNNASLRRVASTCSAATKAIAFGTYTIRLRPEL